MSQRQLPEVEHHELVKPEVRNPPMYRVVLLNDDFTPMEFVVDLLKKFFFMHHERAVQTMLEVHTQGRGICGIFTREIAETKVLQVNCYAREHEQPLQCVMEMT